MQDAGMTATIRPATPADGPAITAIYTHYVLHHTATLETEPPGPDDFARKIADCARRNWPFLVACDRHGTIAGYAYATQFRDRSGYRFTCENSIYVGPDQHGQGIGRALLSALITAATASGFRQMIAVISSTDPASERLHTAQGFRFAGRMHAVGVKFDQWLDTLYLQRSLGEGSDTPAW